MKEFWSHEDLAEAIDLTILPYGKAQTTTRDPPTFVCQHGPSECAGNYVLGCANKYLTEHLVDFYVCMSARYSYSESDVKQCIAQVGAQETVADTIMQCATGSEGPRLHLEAGDETGSVWFVPFVTVNGKFIGTNPNVLTKYVCDAIEGEKPESCQGVSSLRSPMHHGEKHHRRHGLRQAIGSILSPEEYHAIREKFRTYVHENVENNSSPEEMREKRHALKEVYRGYLMEALEKKLKETSAESEEYKKIQEGMDHLKKVFQKA